MSISNGVKKREKIVYVLCDNIRSLYNVGSIFRTADAAGVSKIILGGITGKPTQAGVIKTALGAEKNVPWEHYKNLSAQVVKLKKAGFFIVALEQSLGSADFRKFKPRFPLALVVGNEVSGVSGAILKKADKIIEIPMRGRKESLNVAVAFGVAIFEILK